MILYFDCREQKISLLTRFDTTKVTKTSNLSSRELNLLL
ncbi:hypothetical protein AsAng_0026010 [Aureispira anguillae]|uniref:Uncharacterized protein n=1 Tax=Aureispira anguillae TaxID=2864201 RepID=A0A915YF43_9BACT|nr:hypothetical protein AsAng_0026010 [Aureispira anguillae]